MGNVVSWLHLSDIHFNYKDFNTVRMRDKLLDKIESISKSTHISFIAITGDIAYQCGSYTQNIIDFINEILTRSNISKENLFIVPGNHDVKRGSSRKTMIQTIQDCAEFKEFDNEIEKDLLKAQNSFFNFYKKLKGVSYPSQQIHWVNSSDKYNIIHINTALTCGKDGEEGNLKIGSMKLLEALKRVENSPSINIAIGHHGLDCFSDIDRNDTIYQFNDYNIDLYLCGHIHKSNYSINSDGTREIPTIVCGSNIVDNYGKAGFVIGSFDYEKREGKANYFCWDNDNAQWVIDTKVNRKAVDGVLTFEISRYKNAENNNVYIDDDDFRKFISHFHDNIENVKIDVPPIDMVDINEKFINMKCNQTVKNQYDSLSIYFPIIDQVMGSTSFLTIESKLIVTSIIVEEYNKFFDSFKTGTQILEAIVQEIFDKYKNKLLYSEARLKMYIKILVYWLINECDIFDDLKE